MHPPRTTPYTARAYAREAHAGVCYYHGGRLTDRPDADCRQRTRDHILARAHGRLPATVGHNIRPACRRCNELRARLGHCAGALMLAVLYAHDRKIDVTDAALRLGMFPAKKRKIRVSCSVRPVDTFADPAPVPTLADCVCGGGAAVFRRSR